LSLVTGHTKKVDTSSAGSLLHTVSVMSQCQSALFSNFDKFLCVRQMVIGTRKDPCRTSLWRVITL